MHRGRNYLGVLLGVAGFAATAMAATMAQIDNPAAPGGMTAATGQAFIDGNCIACHSNTAHVAGLTLEKAALSPIGPNAATWEKVVAKLQAGEMPPPNVKTRPDPHQTAALVSWLIGSLDKFAATNPDAGRPVVRRLTRAEYSNAVRDLLAIDVKPGDELPPDVVAFSFNNNGDALSLSPLLLDKYLRVARQVVRLATGDPALPKTLYSYPKPDKAHDWYVFQPPDTQRIWRDGVPFGANGGFSFTYYFPADADYDIRVYLGSTVIPDSQNAIGHRTFTLRTHVTAGSHMVAAMIAQEHALPEGPIPQYDGSAGALGGPIDPLVTTGMLPLLDVRLDGKRIQRFEVKPTSMVDLETPIGTNPGMPAVRTVEIEGPHNAKGVPRTPSRARIFVCHPASSRDETPCAERILSTVLRRAFRHDVSAADVKPFLTIYRKARERHDFEEGIRGALTAVLVSPRFLYRIEDDPQTVAVGRNYPIGDFELASRLSFFLWSSIPDEHLMAAARAGKLRNPKILNQEVVRMLADPKAAALVDNFGMQFLGLQDLDEFMPDKAVYPTFKVTLRDEFQEETKLFLRNIFMENRSIVDLVNANYSYLNEDLAQHYGVSGVFGDEFRRVTFKPDQPRGGVLTQGSVLLVTSHEDVTSPVFRGKWVLTNLLNQPPPNPPPNVPPIVATDPGGKPLTGREQLELHRKSPVCASCHTRMDPFGLSLENFDVTGAWRVKDEGGAVNAAVAMPDGSEWTGVSGLKDRLSGRPEQLANAFAGRLLVYALGRRLEAADQPTVRDIVRKAAAHGYRFDDIVTGVVDSVQFRMRRKAGET